MSHRIFFLDEVLVSYNLHFGVYGGFLKIKVANFSIHYQNG